MYVLVACVLVLPLILHYTRDTEVLSRGIGIVLRSLYTAHHTPGQTPLPTLPFRWPNGQGTEKFFKGRSAAKSWRQNFGPIYGIWSGFKIEIVLTKPEHVEQYFRDSHKHVKARNNDSGWLFGEVLGECVGLVSLQQWRNLRKHIETPFSRPSAMDYTASICKQVREYVSGLNLEQNGTINPSRDLQFYPFFTVASILFGELSEQQRSSLVELAPLREQLFKEVIRGGINRWSIAQYVPGSGAGLLRKFQAKWETFVEQAYSKAKQQSPAAPVAALWEACRSGQISKRECLQTLDESLYANLDVTTNAVAWVTILLAQHPDVQAELRKEMASTDGTSDRYINKQDTFLAACVVEAARLRPILPFSNPESATEDKVVDGYRIPRNTNVIVDSSAINVESPFWVNGNQYDPHRYAKLRKEQVRYNMWRFGFGPRQCLGQHVAERMLRAVAAEMVGRYDMSTSTSGEVQLHEESWVGLPDVEIKCVAREAK